MDDICYTCMWPGTLTDADVDQPETVLCRTCAEALDEQEVPA